MVFKNRRDSLEKIASKLCEKQTTNFPVNIWTHLCNSIVKSLLLYLLKRISIRLKHFKIDSVGFLAKDHIKFGLRVNTNSEPIQTTVKGVLFPSREKKEMQAKGSWQRTFEREIKAIGPHKMP